MSSRCRTQIYAVYSPSFSFAAYASAGIGGCRLRTVKHCIRQGFITASAATVPSAIAAHNGVLPVWAATLLAAGAGVVSGLVSYAFDADKSEIESLRGALQSSKQDNDQLRQQLAATEQALEDLRSTRGLEHRQAVEGVIRQRGLYLGLALSDIYKGLASCHAALRSTKTINLDKAVEYIEEGLDALLSALVDDVVIAMNALAGSPQQEDDSFDIEAHLLMRGPTAETVASARVIARTTERPLKVYTLDESDEEVPFPPARLAFWRPYKDDCKVIPDVREWTEHDCVSQRWRKLWKRDKRLRTRYGAAFVTQIKALNDPRLSGNAWVNVDANTIAVLCIESPRRGRWDRKAQATILAVAAPYLATVRHVLTTYGAMGLLRKQRDMTPFCKRAHGGRRPIPGGV